MGVPELPAAVRDDAQLPARAFGRGARLVIRTPALSAVRARRRRSARHADGVRELRPPRRLEVRQEVETGLVVAPCQP
jgi:hypothetical protein